MAFHSLFKTVVKYRNSSKISLLRNLLSNGVLLVHHWHLLPCEFAILAEKSRGKMKLVSIWSWKYFQMGEFSVKMDSELVSQRSRETWNEKILIFSCESDICINKILDQILPENLKFQKRDYQFLMKVE